MCVIFHLFHKNTLSYHLFHVTCDTMNTISSVKINTLLQLEELVDGASMTNDVYARDFLKQIYFGLLVKNCSNIPCTLGTSLLGETISTTCRTCCLVALRPNELYNTGRNPLNYGRRQVIMRWMLRIIDRILRF